jgi:hypothetical protein
MHNIKKNTKKMNKLDKFNFKSTKNVKLNKDIKPIKDVNLNSVIDYKKSYRQIILELENIKHNETELLKKVNYELKKDHLKKKKVFRQVEHFSFNDFAQIMIGCCVFGLPAFINVSFWDYLPLLRSSFLVMIHLFFILCVILALNYEFREGLNFDFWFIKMLMKRFFFTYFSVFMVIILLLTLVNKLNYDLTNLMVFRHFIAAQSVGMFGAITFTFLKKND